MMDGGGRNTSVRALERPARIDIFFECHSTPGRRKSHFSSILETNMLTSSLDLPFLALELFGSYLNTLSS